MTKIKPKNSTREEAKLVVNKFTTEKGIVLAVSRPNIAFTDNGQILISRPDVMAFYKDQVEAQAAPNPKMDQTKN